MVLASLALLLAVHEMDKSLVWWGLREQLPWAVTHAAIYIFLTVAFALPFLVPLATLGIEHVLQRRRIMAAFLLVGAITTSALLSAVVGSPVGATIEGSHIAYTAQVSYGNLLVALYILPPADRCSWPAASSSYCSVSATWQPSWAWGR
jgi:hypothetical protein